MIAIGAVVDDAIVDVENIVRRLRQARREGSTQPTQAIVLEASVEVRNAIVNASLIEMTSLLPVFFMEGLSGAFFQPLAQAYVVATLVSPLVALTCCAHQRRSHCASFILYLPHWNALLDSTVS